MWAIRVLGAAGRACVCAAAFGILSAQAEEIPASETPEAIAAVLEAKCFACHGPETQKSELRLDSLEALQKGGKSGKPALTPGDAFSSELIRRISLPAEHADVMPPSGKTALTPEETLAIIHWVNRGAPWTTVAAAPETPAPAAEPAAAAGVSFATQIKPILEASCYKCHGTERQKAELRLDTPEAIQQGSENGPIFTAGKPEDSPLFSLIMLPADHPDVMPAQGDPLTPEQIELIRQWILEGAVFDADGAVVAAAPEAPKGPTFEEVLAALAEGVTPAPAEALTSFDGWGVLALPLDQKTPLLQVDFQRAASGVGDEQLSHLETLANQITWLNLAGTDVTDDDLAQVAKLKNLTKLHLERTAITDAGLTHLAPLENLQYLNLYGTQVTDSGLESIKQLPSLHKIFLWQTAVTDDGAAQLAEAKPDLLIDLGWEEPEPEAPAETAAATYDEGSCCATAAGEGKECEHPCCVEARAAGKVCEKCNPIAAAAQAPAAEPATEEPAPVEAAAFDEGSCCATAAGEGKECEHPCCVEARAAGKVCEKCNPIAAAAQAPAAESATEEPAPADDAVATAFDEGSCCATAAGEGKECDHPCCVEARAAGKVCEKCNPNSAA